jgi:hypothetical protein
MIAVVNFRTKQNGAYKYVRSGCRRGYWRVQVLANASGCRRVNCANVLHQVAGSDGIDGVTARSAYNIDSERVRMQAIADAANAAIDAGTFKKLNNY